MKITKIVISLLLLFLCFWSNLDTANATTQDEIKKYVLNAIDFSCYSCFKSTNLQMQIEDTPVVLTFYNYGKSDKEYFARYERNWGNSGGLAIFVRNPDGDFFWRESRGEVIADTVIKTKLPMNAFSGLIALKVNQLFLPKGSVQPNYSMRNFSYGGMSCYKITIKYPPDDETIVLLNKISLKDFNALSEDRKNAFRRKTYSAFELIVGREKFPFIYLYRCYNIYGDDIFAVDIGKPEIISLTESFFEIPTASIKNAQTMADFKKTAQGRYSPPGEFAKGVTSIFKNIGLFLERIGIFLLQHGGLIALVIAIIIVVAIITVVAIIILKIKSRYN